MSVRMYPTAGEATICVVVPPDEHPEDEPAEDAEPTDPADSWARANRRAKTLSRRYIVHNRLRFMWVLTFPAPGKHGPDGRAEVMASVGRLVRRLRAELGALPYWYSPELHPGGHGWHVNLFLPKYVPHHLIERLWGEGYVWVKDWTRDSRIEGATFVEKLRQGARYGAKYAAKDWAAEQLTGRAHRYERAEGFEPPSVEAWCDTLAGGLAIAVGRLGPPVHLWRSDDDHEWTGPPCWVATMQWAAMDPPSRARRRDADHGP